ncbi:MAG: sodium ion-translocating decarboxylase subunit beta [Victivallaceae bacterium]|nr:sodium ion-translocating decarboxylase subunit beta [Victivallaceae bacterium]
MKLSRIISTVLILFIGYSLLAGISATKVPLPEQPPMPATLNALRMQFGQENIEEVPFFSAPDEMFACYQVRGLKRGDRGFGTVYLAYVWTKPMTIYSLSFSPGYQLSEGNELMAMKPDGRTKGKLLLAQPMVCTQMRNGLAPAATVTPGEIVAAFSPAAFYHNSLAEGGTEKSLPSWGSALAGLWKSTGIFDMYSQTVANFPQTWMLGIGHIIMVIVALTLIYLAIVKDFEPLLLLPIGFGALLANIPLAGISGPGGLQYQIYQVGIESGVFPLLIFMGVGAMTDFGPLIANPKTALLGGAAQIGIFGALLGALMLNVIPGINFGMKDAASIGIIGGADGPTSIFLCTRLSPSLLGAVAVAAYSYMALVPIIQPPIMRLCTNEAERKIRMKQLRPVSKIEKIVFPLIITLLCLCLLPDAAPLIGMLMFGNLMRECGVVERLNQTAQNALINIVTIFLGIAVGSKLAADQFLSAQTLGILFLGCLAFCLATAGGVLFAKVMNLFSSEKINPLIGSAGVSAVPMAARVSNKLGLEYDSQNYLLMHAMGPNVSGVIGSAVAAGVLLKLCESL